MPPPPMSEKSDGRVSPAWCHTRQAKPAILDLEFLHFSIDPCLVTEVGIWRVEEPAPVTWKVRPPPSYLREIERCQPRKWHSIKAAAKINGYNAEGWKDAKHWHDVRVPIAKALWNRQIWGLNSWAADIRRLESMFHPHDKGWIRPHSSVDIEAIAVFKGHKKTSLEALCEAYGIQKERTHTAESGVRTVRAVCEAMLGVRDANAETAT